MICLKIRTFVVSATTYKSIILKSNLLWFAWKFVPLWYQQQRHSSFILTHCCCDLLENSYLCGISNNINFTCRGVFVLWFAWKFVPLWYQQQPYTFFCYCLMVVICLKIRTFVVSATTDTFSYVVVLLLWFAWKFVPLWYQQQPWCYCTRSLSVVICLKIRTFVVSATTRSLPCASSSCCDLLENSYLCGISNNWPILVTIEVVVVICLKIRTFVVSATTPAFNCLINAGLWFAWKFVPLWYQQQHIFKLHIHWIGCDLLENSYLCGISNNRHITWGNQR